MNCGPVKELVGAYFDGELEAARRDQVEAHLTGCPECALLLGDVRSLSGAIHAGPFVYEAPARLEEQILRAVRKSSRPGIVNWKSLDWGWMAAAACLVLAIAIGWNLRRAPERQLVAQDVVSGHVRSLMGSHLLDVPSTDRHTVKPWFAGKLDFSPEVRDLAPQGFPLLGGRLDYLDGRPVAALVFRRRQHIVNLFEWSAGEGNTKARQTTAKNGYNVVHWTAAGLTYWAVADIPGAELEQFAALYK
jgi:anti-sigma factor RsiW